MSKTFKDSNSKKDRSMKYTRKGKRKEVVAKKKKNFKTDDTKYDEYDVD